MKSIEKNLPMFFYVMGVIVSVSLLMMMLDDVTEFTLFVFLFVISVLAIGVAIIVIGYNRKEINKLKDQIEKLSK